ncbi:MAG: hypothetical protein FJ297_00030 [Planctomycetes bacterium]|nr:hypothetical protein [Planctomycetota bacterium]
MPTYDLGYCGWSGDVRSAYGRWAVIAEMGIRLAWRSTWLRRLLLVAWLPAVYCGIFLFLFENAAKSGATQIILGQVGGAFRSIPEFAAVREAVETGGLETARHEFWALLLWLFFRHPQGVLMVILVGLVSPNLISQDLRTKAHLIYFSRPISTWEYVLGKATVLFVYLSLITVLPALSLYLLGVVLSPDLGVIRHTWDLPLRILAASVVLIIPTTSLALCYSSLTRETRYAGFAWFATFILGWVAFMALTARDFAAQGIDGLATASGRWTCVSIYHTLGRVQNWVFGLHHVPEQTTTAALALAIMTVLSIGILLRRVTSPLRV